MSTQFDSSKLGQNDDFNGSSFDIEKCNSKVEAIEKAIDMIGEELYDALKMAKDRVFILKSGEEMDRFIRDVNRCDCLDIATANSYQKMIVHKVAAYYNLVPETEPSKLGVALYKSPLTCLPPKKLGEVVPHEGDVPPPSVKIMRRSPTLQPSPVPSNTTNNSKTDSTDINVKPNNSKLSKDKSKMSMEEREAAYLEARSRIFMNIESESSNNTPEPRSSMTSTPSSVNNETNSTSDINNNNNNSNSDSNLESEVEPFGPDDIPRDLSRLPQYQRKMSIKSEQQLQQQKQQQSQMFTTIPTTTSPPLNQTFMSQQQQAQAAIAASNAIAAATGQFWNPWSQPNPFLPPLTAPSTFMPTTNNDNNQFPPFMFPPPATAANPFGFIPPTTFNTSFRPPMAFRPNQRPIQPQVRPMNRPPSSTQTQQNHIQQLPQSQFQFNQQQQPLSQAQLQQPQLSQPRPIRLQKNTPLNPIPNFEGSLNLNDNNNTNNNINNNMNNNTSNNNNTNNTNNINDKKVNSSGIFNLNPSVLKQSTTPMTASSTSSSTHNSNNNNNNNNNSSNQSMVNGNNNKNNTRRSSRRKQQNQCNNE